MARPFSTREVNRLVSEHFGLKKSLTEAKNSSGQYKNNISKAAEALLAQKVLKILKDIPIEEINRDKRGFRIKPLRDYGYNNIADISTASVYTIASIHGIGEDTAHSIKRTVNIIVSKARMGVTIRLNADDKNARATELVSALSRYERSKTYIETCSNILNSQGKQIDYALQDLEPATSGFKWFFTSSVNKQKAIDAYNVLRQLLENEYSKETRAALTSLNMVNHSTEIEDWQYFLSNSIDLNKLLNKIKPGILGNDDTLYGLPEELAREIQEECFFPDGLLCELRRYQEWGVKYILHQNRVLLGDEMGLGKTIQAIATMVSLRNTGATHFVVVCPASVIINWCREIRKMSLLSVTKIHGAGKTPALNSWIKTGGVAVTTYETSGNINLEYNFKFSLLVVDEAHYIKNPEASRTVNVRNLCTHAERLLFMTGTALENKVDEMIELIKVLQPPIAYQIKGMTFMSSAPQFRNKVAPVYYRRKREDVLTELPELIESKEWCTMLAEEEKIYEKAILSKNYAEARRVSWNVDNLNNSSKAKRLLEIIEEVEGDGRKVIVFSFFLDTLRKVSALLGERCLNPINGSVSPQRRQEIIDEFDKASAGTVLVAQIQSGGTGLNIQSASVVIICEPQFKPSTENQAISRAYRMGQARNVLVYRLLCENSVDEKISSLLEDKQAIFDAFADKSVAAKESLGLDDKKFGDIIKEEIERINAKREIKEELIGDEEVS